MSFFAAGQHYACSRHYEHACSVKFMPRFMENLCRWTTICCLNHSAEAATELLLQKQIAPNKFPKKGPVRCVGICGDINSGRMKCNLLVIRNTKLIVRQISNWWKEEIQVNWSFSTWICSRDDVDTAPLLLGFSDHCWGRTKLLVKIFFVISF